MQSPNMSEQLQSAAFDANPRISFYEGACHDLNDAELVEIVGNVAVMTLTNFLSNLAHTDVDFPRVPATV
jgi:hypothetical protein